MAVAIIISVKVLCQVESPVTGAIDYLCLFTWPNDEQGFAIFREGEGFLIGEMNGY